jgi:poly(hydroxyalkanoate) granule-associated protein
MAARTKARTKRTTRTTRKATSAVGRIETLRANAMGAVDKIVKQGNALQAKAMKVAAAQAKVARSAVMGARDTVSARADEARTRTMDAVSQLEKVFENRVQTAISKLGVPTARDVRALSRQVAQLQQSVDQLRRSRARA